MALVSGGCAAQQLNALTYTRNDGAPIDADKAQATLAQCKGEAVSAPPGPFDWGRRENTLIAACMARNGYIHAQQ
jgi:hypothetical protein